MPRRGTITVYDDGKCAFCQWAREVIQRRDVNGRIQFRDYNDPAQQSEVPFSYAELDHQMHVLTADGLWRKGFFAWLEVFGVLPYWRWLGRLLGVPPFRWIGPAVYRLVAANRYRFPRFLLTWLGAPQPCGEQCALPASAPKP